MGLTIAFITSRRDPKIEWFADSLAKQLQPDDFVQVIVVQHYKTNFIPPDNPRWIWAFEKPKPNVWQGEHRLTSCDWWAKSNAMNTAICLCTTEFIAFTDDRCVLVPEWLQCVREAMDGNYAVCGSYEKRANLKVENGEITDFGELLGFDTRHQFGHPVVTKDWYGGSCALPLEWCLTVQGFPEMADGLGLEDCMFGATLKNNGFPMRFDSRMRLIEDRTPGQIDGALKRADKDVHLGQKAKSWALVRALQYEKTSQNPFDIRNMRARVLNGEDWRPYRSRI
jgi:hypothetical protein